MGERRIDATLERALTNIERQIESLHAVEAIYLELESSKKPLLSNLTLAAQGKSHAERLDIAQSSNDYQLLCKTTADKEAAYNRERRRYDLLLKAYDAYHLTYKIEESAIRRQK